jgi:hypothetical protein
MAVALAADKFVVSRVDTAITVTMIANTENALDFVFIVSVLS